MDTTRILFFFGLLSVAALYKLNTGALLDGIDCHEKTATLHRHSMGDNRNPIVGYSIEYNTTFTPDTWASLKVLDIDIDTSWTVQLSPWANYTFRLVTWNRNGREIGPSTPSSHPKVCTTQPDVPYKNPDNVVGEGSDPTNMVISWSKMPQIEHNGPGFYYLVTWRRNITGQPWNEEQVRDWQQTEYVVPNTPTFVPYKVKVTAVNYKGTSNVKPVEVIGWSGEDIPLQGPLNFTLVQVTTSTTALLSWNPVPLASVRGHFKGYKIQTWVDGEEDRLKEILVKADVSSTLVSKLKPYKKNNARILVYNGRFNGPPSDTLSFHTPEGKPGTVKSFEVYHIGSSAMLLKWDKPVDENGVLTGYKIYYQKVTGTSLGPIQERKKKIDPNSNRAKLAGLEPNTKYRIEIRATTKAGEGDRYYVEQSTETAKLEIPLFQTSTLLAKEGTAHILVRWLPSLDGHAGTHFVAWYKLKGHPDWSKTNDVTDDDYVILTGLEPGQVYEVKLTAHDGEYFSASEIKDVDTTIATPFFTVEPENQNLAKGESAEIKCEAHGTPIPKITWIHNGKPIKEAEPNPRRLVTPNSIVITNLMKEDTGNYGCNATNSIGYVYKEVYVHVQTTPFFTVEPENQNLAEGESAEIKCEAHGTRIPKITWIHNGKPIEEAEPNPRRLVTPNSIVITNLMKEDTGNYGCNATNSIGYVYKEVYVHVQSKKGNHSKSTIIISSMSGTALIVLVVVALRKRCWINNNPLGTPQLPTTEPSNPFYLNLLFRRECDAEIEEIEQHHYEEIEYPYEEIERSHREGIPIYEEINPEGLAT